MRLDQQFRPFLMTFWRACVLAATLFAFGMPLSAFGQPPATPPGTQPPAAPAVQTAAQNLGCRHGTPRTMDEAVRMAMENNLGVRAERLNPEIQNYGVVRAHSAFTPALFSSVTRGKQRDAADRLSVDRRVWRRSPADRSRPSRGMQQILPIGGGKLPGVVGRIARRPTHRARCSAPSSDPHLNASYTQPLLRNFRIDAFRQQFIQSQKPPAGRGHPAALAHRLRPRGTCRAAYYNLVGAIAGLDVAQQSLDLARQVAQGQSHPRGSGARWRRSTSWSAEAEVASNEEYATTAAVAVIETSQDVLRASPS